MAGALLWNMYMSAVANNTDHDMTASSPTQTALVSNPVCCTHARARIRLFEFPHAAETFLRDASVGAFSIERSLAGTKEPPEKLSIGWGYVKTRFCPFLWSLFALVPYMYAVIPHMYALTQLNKHQRKHANRARKV